MEESSESSSSSFGTSHLVDRWSRGAGVPLNGPLERTSFDEATLGFVTGLLGLAVAFVLFQFILSPILLFTQIGLSEGGLSMEVLSSPEQLLATYTRELIISNSVGQVLGLAVPALLMTRLHSTQFAEYLRFRSVDGRLLLLALVGIVGIQPVTQWLAAVNRELPVPEALRMLDESQMELIRNVLESDLGLTFNLLSLALVPGLCEEILFRGYAQRQFERATGPAGGIVLAGVLFGLYHLRPSQVLPLIMLGLFMAYLVWRTGSLLPAILVHVVHNGIAVGAAQYVRRHPEYDLTMIEEAAIPWYAVLVGFVIVGAVLYVIHKLGARLRPA